jgi:hypothetical protein
MIQFFGDIEVVSAQTEEPDHKLIIVVILAMAFVGWMLISHKAKRQKKTKHIITDWPDGGFGSGPGAT